ncbi:MAG: TAXI family TRAP transporter solute-binding subunit [Alcaligenaceae bacterium]
MAIGLISILLIISGKLLFDLIPRNYVLSITGGSVLSERHFLIKLLQDEVAKSFLSLKVAKTVGSLEALELVNAGKIDLALVTGGVANTFPNVRHVATLPPEFIHFVVKPSIKNLEDLKGKVINMGERSENTGVLARQILTHLNLVADSDYAETNFSNEELIGMRDENLPDAIVEVSYAPSVLVDFFVKRHDYRVLAMPFSSALAKRISWISSVTLNEYMYSVVPPVPSKNIPLVGVNLHLVANEKVEQKAIVELLKTLYGPRVDGRFSQDLVKTDLLIPSGYPLSSGTILYLDSQKPILTTELSAKLKTMIELLVSLGSVLILVWRWFKSEQDEEFKYETTSLEELVKAKPPKG